MDQINPTRSVKLSNGEAVTVRGLAWPDAIEFFTALAAHLGALLNGGTTLRLDDASLHRIVTGSAELIEVLVTKSTGKEKAWLMERGIEEVMDLVDAAWEVSFPPSLIEKGKRFFARLAPALQARSNSPG